MLPHALVVFIPLNVRIILALCCHHRNLILKSLTLVLDNHRPAVLLICCKGRLVNSTVVTPALALLEAMRERKMTKKTKKNWTGWNSPPWRSALMALQLQLVQVLRQEEPSRGVHVPTHPYELVRHLHVPLAVVPAVLQKEPRVSIGRIQSVQQATDGLQSFVFCSTTAHNASSRRNQVFVCASIATNSQALKPLMFEFVDLRSGSPNDHCFRKHQQRLSVLFAEKFGIRSHSSVSTTTKPRQDPSSMSKRP